MRASSAAADEARRQPRRPSRAVLLGLRLLVLAAFFLLWQAATATGVLDPFFFGRPTEVLARTVAVFADGSIWHHLGVTLAETVLAFVTGTAAGVVAGFWLARAPLVAAVSEPYIKAANAVPRVVLAPIFALWLGLGIWSKVALGFTLVFFVVFFNVYQGVREVDPVLLANARMLGMGKRHLLRHVYVPSALAWLFSSLHTAIGFALVGAVVGEYLGAAAGIGYMIAQAEGVFDTNGVFSGMLILTVLVLVIDALVTLAERRLLRWRPQAAAGGFGRA